eukprot:15476695-Alexandrium_andersonii.AAC.1
MAFAPGSEHTGARCALAWQASGSRPAPVQAHVARFVPVAICLKVDQRYPAVSGARSAGPGPNRAAATISTKGRGQEGVGAQLGRGVQEVSPPWRGSLRVAGRPCERGGGFGRGWSVRRVADR